MIAIIPKCNIVPDGEYDLYCTVHDRIDRECYREEIRLLNLEVSEMQPVVDAALKYANMGGRVDVQNRDLFEAAIAYRKKHPGKPISETEANRVVPRKDCVDIDLGSGL